MRAFLRLCGSRRDWEQEGRRNSEPSAQTQGREGVSLGKGSQDATNHFFRTTAIQTPPSQAAVHSNPLHTGSLPKPYLGPLSDPSGSSETPVSGPGTLGSNKVPFLPLLPEAPGIWLQLPTLPDPTLLRKVGSQYPAHSNSKALASISKGFSRTSPNPPS